LDMTYATSTSQSNAGSSGMMADPIAAGMALDQPQTQEKPMVFHDLWATMTLGWGVEGVQDLDMTDTGVDFGQI
jgi:hypothetical protein